MSVTQRRIYLDTDAIIYYAEAHPRLGPPVDAIVSAGAKGLLTIVTSELCLAEALVLPLRLGQRQLVEAYENLLTSRLNFTVWPVSRAILVGCAQLRAVQRIKTPDAIHVAPALAANCTHLVSEDGFHVPSALTKVLVSEALSAFQLF
jgi:predicted nucleic acid-binding protein